MEPPLHADSLICILAGVFLPFKRHLCCVVGSAVPVCLPSGYLVYWVIDDLSHLFYLSFKKPKILNSRESSVSVKPKLNYPVSRKLLRICAAITRQLSYDRDRRHPTALLRSVCTLLFALLSCQVSGPLSGMLKGVPLSVHFPANYVFFICLLFFL